MTRTMATSTKVSLCFVILVITSVKGGRLTKPSFVGDNHALPGTTVEFKCLPLGSANITYQWFKNDKPIPHQNKRTLPIHNVSSEDEGDYSCRTVVAGTGEMSPTSGKHSFFMAVPPEVEIEQAKSGGVLQLVEGSGVNLTCNLLNSPKPPPTRGSYWWTFLPIRGGNLTRMSREEDCWIDRQRTSGQECNLSGYWGARGTQLILSSLNRTQSGRFTCHVNNSSKASQNTASGTASIYIQIQYLDQPVVISPSTRQTVVAEDNVTLTCQVDSEPTATLTWLHEGRILRSVESNQDVFSFTATGSKDSGEYQCRARNEAINKTASHGIQIAVEYAPTPEGSGELPTVMEVSGREGENLTLSVKASGNPPPAYTWSDQELSIGQGSSSLTLQHLQPFHAGIYTVNVSNVHGSFLHVFNVAVQPASASAVADGDVSAVWLTVAGAVIFLLVALSIFLFVLRRRRTRAAKSERQIHEAWLQMESLTARPPDSSSRRRRRRRWRRRWRQDSSDGGGTPHQEPSDRVPRENGDAGARVAAKFPWPEDKGEDVESTAFVLPPPDPVVPKERDPAPVPPFSPLTDIPMRLYPWAAIQLPENMDSADELEDKYGLPKNLHLPFHQPQPDLDLNKPGPMPEDSPTASRSREDAFFFFSEEEEGEEELDNVYGVVDVVRGKRRRPPRRRPTPEEEGAAETSELPEAPPRPHFRTLASLQEEGEEGGELTVDVFTDVPRG